MRNFSLSLGPASFISLSLIVTIFFPFSLYGEHLAGQLMDGDNGLDSSRGAALQFIRQGLFSKAAHQEEMAFQIAQDQYGPVSPVLAPILDDLAAIYRYQARYQEAETQYKWELAIREKVLGPDDPGVAESLDHLASLYVEEARDEEAELLYKRALGIQEKTSLEKSLTVAQTLENLGRLYLKTSRIPQAKTSLSRSLEIQEKALGPDVTALAGVLKELYLVSMAEKDFKEAETLLQRVLKIKEKNFQAGHPQIADSMDDLGDFYEAQGEKEKARGLYEQALVVHQRTLGPDIYTSIPFLNRGAKTHMALGHYAEAEILFKRILGICKQVFGTGHPQVAIALADLASAEERIPKESHKAAADLKESLAILRKSLGDNHPLSAQVQERLAKLSTR